MGPSGPEHKIFEIPARERSKGPTRRDRKAASTQKRHPLATKIKFTDGIDLKTPEGRLQFLKDVFKEQLDTDEADVVPEAHIVNDLNADSLDRVELIMSLEESLREFGYDVEITDEMAEKLETVGQVLDQLTELVGSD